MMNRLETRIDGALGEIINTPVCPEEALVERIAAKAKKGEKGRRRVMVLLAALAALLLNAVLACLLVLRVVHIAGFSWITAAAVLAGLMLIMLPSVLLLSASDLLLQNNQSKKIK